MIEKFEQLIAIFVGQRRTGIRNRLLYLVLAGCLLTFVSMGLLSLAGIFTTWNILKTNGETLGTNASTYTAAFAERQAKLNLEKNNRMRAMLINNTLKDVALDVDFLSREMTNIMSTPEKYRPRSLPNARYEIVRSRTPYVHFNSDLASRGVSAELQREIELASNIVDTFETIIEYNPCAFVGSKNGYVLKIDVMPSNSVITSLSKEPERTNYDVLKRAWYTLGVSVTKPTFTDIYTAAMTGEPCVSCAMPYYDANGEIAGAVGLDCNPSEIYQKIRETAIGSSGFCFVLNSKGEVLYSTQREGDFVTGLNLLDENDDPNVNSIGRLMISKGNGLMEIHSDGEDYYVAYAPMEVAQWSIATVLNKSEVNAPAMIARTNIITQIDKFKEHFSQLFLFLLCMAVVLLGFVMFGLFRVSVNLSNRFVEPIHQLSDGVRDIASGDFGKTLDIQTGDELQHLATCFNGMTAELKTYMANLTKVTTDKERIATELNVATEIQLSMLPKEFDFGRTDFELFATMHAAKEVGGDFYDFYMLDENHLIITIADVSGKGVPAALFMMTSKTILKNLALMMAGSNDVSKFVSKANDQLCQNNDAMMFVTVFVGMLNLKTGQFTYVNGGHNPPMLYRATEDRFAFLNSSARNYALGLMDGIDFEQESITLAAGDALLLYTDGVTEALNKAEELYGDDRLEECLNRLGARRLKIEEIMSEVKRSLDDYVDGAPQSDDITMLGLKYKG